MSEDTFTGIMRDGVAIPLPEPEEMDAFRGWLKQNKIKEPFHKDQHYDLVSAFRAGLARNNKNMHFPDTFKLPGHQTFSIESIYYKKGMPAGRWEGEKYIPVDR